MINRNCYLNSVFAEYFSQQEHGEEGSVAGRENVEVAVKQLMGGGKAIEEMGRRAKELAEKAKRTVEEGRLPPVTENSSP